jgi:hypothetical protein
MASRADKFRQAAITYIGLGVVVIALTLVAGTSPQRGTPPLIGLLIGAIFVAIFGGVIYSYAWMTKGGARRAIAILTGILVVPNVLRSLQYFINFLGYRLEIATPTTLISGKSIFAIGRFGLVIHPSEFSFPILFLICALLMTCIVYMLARAAWDL